LLADPVRAVSSSLGMRKAIHPAAVRKLDRARISDGQTHNAQQASGRE